jgi:hypothetical protein
VNQCSVLFQLRFSDPLARRFLLLVVVVITTHLVYSWTLLMLCLALLLFHFYCNRNFDWFVTNKTILYNIACRSTVFTINISCTFIWVPFSNTFCKGNVSLFESLSVSTPEIVPLLWEKVSVLIKKLK